MLFDGNGDVTQFGVVINPVTSNTKFPVKITAQASEINFYGGDFNCGGLDAGGGLEASIGMDLRGTAGSNSGGEFSIFGTHTINCLTGISALETANLNYYGIMEQPSGDQEGDGIVIDGTAHASKNTIAGSIDGFTRGVRLLGTNTSDNRILANITATATPIDASPTLLRTAFILTPRNYAGSGAAIGTQIPTDLTIPDEAVPPPPATGSRRIFVNGTAGAGDDLTAEKADGSTVDLESGLRNYQATLTAIQGNPIAFLTVYTFSIPSIPAGKGVRVKAFWQCTITGGAKTFSWRFGTTSTAYSSYSTSTNALTSAEVTIFNNPNSQTAQTMFVGPIVQGTSLLSAGTVASPGETTSAPVTLELRFQAPNSEFITPKGFIVEAIQ